MLLSESGKITINQFKFRNMKIFPLKKSKMHEIVSVTFSKKKRTISNRISSANFYVSYVQHQYVKNLFGFFYTDNSANLT